MKNFLIPTLLSLSLVCLTSAKSATEAQKLSVSVQSGCDYIADVALINFLSAHGYRASSPNIPADILRAAYQEWQNAFDRCVAEHRSTE